MQTFSTDVVAPSERFSYWREVLTQHFIHLRPERSDRAPFSGVLEAPIARAGTNARWRREICS